MTFQWTPGVKGLKNKHFTENFGTTSNFDKFLKKYQSKSRLLVKLWIGNFSKREVDVVMNAFGEFLAQLFFSKHLLLLL